MSDSSYERAISFNLGKAFPADDPIALFVVALSLAWNDLLNVNMRLVGGNEHGPAKQAVSDRELHYLVGVAFAHLYEMRTCVSHARGKWEEVAAFLDRLPADAQNDLRQVLDLNTTEHDWIEPTLRYLRHQTFHYGATTNWKDLRWAIREVRAEEGVISTANDTYAGTRLDFAELIWAQHLTRKLPAAAPDTDDKSEQEFQKRQLRTLVEALTSALNAAIRFAMAALGAYLDKLPDGTVTWKQ